MIQALEPGKPAMRTLMGGCLFLFALLSYFQFPGHTYLESDTQIYIPMFERFRNPALLERDPMVLRPHTAFTLYDELALGLNRLTGWGFESVLGVLHVIVRLTLLTGVFLITRAMGLSEVLALACAGVYALGGWVSGPAVLLVEYEPVPRAFALGPVLLGLGLAAHRRYIAAGLAGAAGFLMHPTTAGPFWTVFAILLFVPEEPEEMESRLWGFLPLALAVAGLKLASTMQPGMTEPQALLARVDEAWEELIRMRAPYVYVSTWRPLTFWQYGLMLAAAIPAYLRLRRYMQPTLRFFAVGLSALGLLGLPASYLLLEKLKWGMVAEIQPARALLFLELFTMLLALVLAFELACREGRIVAAGWWAAVGLAVGIDARLLFVLAPPALAWLADWRLRWMGLVVAGAVVWLQPFGFVFWRGGLGQQLLLTVVLAALVAASAALSLRHRIMGATAVVAVVAAAFYLVPGGGRLHWSGEKPHPELAALSQWAREHTAVNAVFLFADADRSPDAGVFRARAARAVYVDWKSGGQINFFHDYSRIWWSRWQRTMAGPFHPDELPRFRQLGIDYVLLSTKNRLPDRQPVFENSGYLAYRLD